MMNEAMEKATGPEALDDDLLDAVVGGLVQLVNPSSSRYWYHYFLDGTVCQHCGCKKGSYKKIKNACSV